MVAIRHSSPPLRLFWPHLSLDHLLGGHLRRSEQILRERSRTTRPGGQRRCCKSERVCR